MGESSIKKYEEKDIRPKLIWLSGIIAVVFVFSRVLLLAYMDIIDRSIHFSIKELPGILQMLFFLWLPIAFGVILSLWLSGVKNKLKKYFLMYGIPIFVIISFTYFIYDFHTCSGKLCEFNSLFFGLIEISFLCPFAIFYIIGTYARQKSVKFIIWVIIVEVIFLLLFGLFYGVIIQAIFYFLENFYKLFKFLFYYK